MQHGQAYSDIIMLWELANSREYLSTANDANDDWNKNVDISQHLLFFLIFTSFEYLAMNELLSHPLYYWHERRDSLAQAQGPTRVGSCLVMQPCEFPQYKKLELISSRWMSQCSLWCSTDSYDQNLFDILTNRLYYKYRFFRNFLTLETQNALPKCHHVYPPIQEPLLMYRLNSYK